MIKISILNKILRDNLLHDKIFLELGYRQSTISQSFSRCIKDNKPSGRSHDAEVLLIIKNHLNMPFSEILNSIQE